MTASIDPIRVGYTYYIVQVLPSLDDDNYGMCDTHFKCIYVSKNQRADSFADTLLHEVLHAIWFESGLFKIKRPDEETIVHMSATWLTMVLRDNPQFGKILTAPTEYWTYEPFNTNNPKATTHE